MELIHEEMQQIIYHCGQDVQQEMTRFPKLFEKIVTIASDVIRRYGIPKYHFRERSEKF